VQFGVVRLSTSKQLRRWWIQYAAAGTEQSEWKSLVDR